MFLLPALLLACSGLPTQTTRPDALFADTERARIVAYWNAPGRYSVGAPPTVTRTGIWQVRLTPEASVWFYNYQIAVGQAKLPPTQDAHAATPQTELWEKWVSAKLAYDRWKAQKDADTANTALLNGFTPRGNLPDRKGSRNRRNPQRTDTTPPARTSGVDNPPDDSPAYPGPIPDDLKAILGNPPPFAAVVAPLRHTITFEDGDIYDFSDNVAMRPRFAYYRFPQGVMSEGTPVKEMPPEEVEGLFAAAGLTRSEQKIAKAVSIHEGGFEAINTYDTGYVSVGFLQFITLNDGKHSLSDVLYREKTDRPDDYANDFRRYGIDIAPDRTLTVLDPATGVELSGFDAVHKVIDDKRLIAVFQRAGRRSKAFRIAQIQVAKSNYWPSEDVVQIILKNGQKVSGKVSEIIKSEAGLATLFDRKINRGSIAPFADVVSRIMTTHRLTRYREAAKYEREIIAALKYRSDYLADKTLGQPAPVKPDKPSEPDSEEEIASPVSDTPPSH